MKLTSKQLNAIKNCKTAEELVSLAKENGIEISAEKAEKFISKGISTLSDENLSEISGGAIIGGGIELPEEGCFD